MSSNPRSRIRSGRTRLLVLPLLSIAGLVSSLACASAHTAAPAAEPAASMESPAPSGDGASAAAAPEEEKAPVIKGDVTGPLALLAAEVASGAVASEAPEPADLEPPDGEWLIDEEGREYYIAALAKDGPYLRLDDHLVRTRWGISIRVDHEDDDNFYYRVYRVTESTAWVDRDERSAEEIAASYAVDVKVRDDLRLQPMSDGLPDAGQWRNGFAVADVDGDGHLDIVHGPARKSLGGPSIFRGDGGGHWSRWPEIRFELSRRLDYGDVAVADFDGDGSEDIVFGSHLMGVVATVQTEPGRFVEWTDGMDYSVPGHGGDASTFSSRAVDTLDWNGDGRPDVVALGEGPRLNLGRGGLGGPPPGQVDASGSTVYLNLGDGSWQPLRMPVHGQPFGDSVAPGDFDGDGREDFATGLNVRLGREIVYLNRGDQTPELLNVAELRPGGYARAVAAADFDGDGRDDLVVAFMASEGGVWRTGIDLLYARDAATWERKALYVEEGREGLFAVAAGDLDGDGRKDVAALSGDGRVIVLLGGEKGSFVRLDSAVPQFPGRCRGYDVAFADVDEDGRDELVAAFAGEPSPMFDPDRCRTGGGIQVWDLPPAALGGGD